MRAVGPPMTMEATHGNRAYVRHRRYVRSRTTRSSQQQPAESHVCSFAATDFHFIPSTLVSPFANPLHDAGWCRESKARASRFV